MACAESNFLRKIIKKSHRKILGGGYWGHFWLSKGKSRVQKPFGGKCLKKGHWKFGIPENVI